MGLAGIVALSPPYSAEELHHFCVEFGAQGAFEQIVLDGIGFGVETLQKFEDPTRQTHRALNPDQRAQKADHERKGAIEGFQAGAVEIGRVHHERIMRSRGPKAIVLSEFLLITG